MTAEQKSMDKDLFEAARLAVAFCEQYSVSARDRTNIVTALLRQWSNT